MASGCGYIGGGSGYIQLHMLACRLRNFQYPIVL
ncbi:MAG: hypothetical protein ACJAUG_002947 [Halioglobus sp.]|jgi:hypothetical protein